MRPEDAGERARAEAERLRAEGTYPADTGAGPSAAGGPPDLNKLREWAAIAVDPELVYSTRKGGAPVTALKRLMLRLMRQYTTELEAQQTRFNMALLAYLEKRERGE